MRKFLLLSAVILASMAIATVASLIKIQVDKKRAPIEEPAEPSSADTP